MKGGVKKSGSSTGSWTLMPETAFVNSSLRAIETASGGLWLREQVDRNPYCHPIAEIIFGIARVRKKQGIIREKVDWVFDERLIEQGKFFRCGKP
jgi:hypothetical protein